MICRKTLETLNIKNQSMVEVDESFNNETRQQAGCALSGSTTNVDNDDRNVKHDNNYRSPSSNDTDDSLPKRLNSIDGLINGFFDIVGFDELDGDFDEDSQEFVKEVNASITSEKEQDKTKSSPGQNGIGNHKSRKNSMSSCSSETQNGSLSTIDITQKMKDLSTDGNNSSKKKKEGYLFTLRRGAQGRSTNGIVKEQVKEQVPGRGLHRHRSDLSPAACIAAPRRVPRRKSGIEGITSMDSKNSMTPSNRRWGLNRLHASSDDEPVPLRRNLKRTTKATDSDESTISIGSCSRSSIGVDEQKTSPVAEHTIDVTASAGLSSLLDKYFDIVDASDDNMRLE